MSSGPQSPFSAVGSSIAEPSGIGIERIVRAQALRKIVGQSTAVRRLINQISCFAKNSTTVLISGETGTGKELAARAIHYSSDRAGGPFVPVNCGAISESLIEAELFGHERGAFTDARNKSPGLIGYANRGTFFLDEVDSLSLKAQVSLLRVLQDKKVRPVGSVAEREVDVRFVAATNTDLASLVKAGSFRSDLYYRLRIFSVEIPPLRERTEDILPLARHLLEKNCGDGSAPTLSDGAQRQLLAHPWHGNIRELENAIIRAICLCGNEAIRCEHLGLAEVDLEPRTASSPVGKFSSMKQAVIAAFEKDYLARLLIEHRGNVSRAARTSGKDRRDLGRLVKKYGLNAKDLGVQFPPAT